MIVIATQCFPPALGGVETLMLGLAEAAAADGRAVVVLADGPEDPGDAARGFEVRRFGGWKPLRRRMKALALARLARRAEVVICDSWKSLELARLGARAAPAHCLAHGMEIPVDAGAAKARRIAATFRKARKVIANSTYSAGLAARFLPQSAPPLVATPPIAPQPEPSAAAVARLAETLGPEAGPVVAFVGRLEPRKGVDRVIEAVAALRGAHPTLVFAVAGSGADRGRLESLANALGVAPRVRFLGRVDEDEKAALLARADVFAMPARREGASVEGFGIVYLEAGWHGAPSIAGREGGASDVVRDGETGRLCDGADADAVRSALAALLGDPVERHRMSFLAQAHARDQVWSRRLLDFL